MALKVVKFGGSSLADAQQFKKVARIIEADEARRFVVPSAPGNVMTTTQKLPICFMLPMKSVKKTALKRNLHA